MSHSTSLWPGARRGEPRAGLGVLVARGLRSGYDKRSAGVLLAVVAVGVASGVVWRDYLSLTWEDFDPLLVFCWVLMVALGAFRFSLRKDLPLAGVAFVGGALIETWGTRSGLWTYFTGEKPPLFILPAWPLAALATERLSRLLGRLAPDRDPRPWRFAYALAMGVFCIYLWSWTAPGRAHPTTPVAYALVATACLTVTQPRRDVLLFVAGSALGWLLEYWGTTRQCWTYWDGRTPPLCAVLSHGFATVAFARGVWLAEKAVGLLRAPAPRGSEPTA